MVSCFVTHVLAMCVWIYRFQMVRWIRLSEYSTRLYRMCPGPRWDTLPCLNSISSPSALFEIVLSLSLVRLFVCACKICIFANVYCVYGVHVRSGFVHGRSAVVPWAHAGVCWCDDRERTSTQAACRRTGYTPGRVNAHCLCFIIQFSEINFMYLMVLFSVNNHDSQICCAYLK